MISSKDLQKRYIDLYKSIRNYIWDYQTVEYLANLEVAVYTTFPDIQEIRKQFNSLYLDIRDVLIDDEEFREAVNEFKELIENEDTLYSKIDMVNEVNQQ